MADLREKTGWTEQLINRVVKAALGRLVDAETFEVDIRTNLKQLSQGTIEAIAVQFDRVWMREHLCVERLQLDIGQVIVKPLRAMRGDIQLVRPAEGRLLLLLQEQQLSIFLQNALSRYLIASSHRQKPPELFAVYQPERQDAVRMEWIRARILPGSSIAFDVAWTINNLTNPHASTLLTQPRLTTALPGQSPRLELEVQSIDHDQPPTELTTALLTLAEEILNLHDLRDRGFRYQVQQIQTTTGKLTIEAHLSIDQFPK